MSAAAAATSEASTTVVDMNPEAVEKLLEFVGKVVGKELARPEGLAQFVALLVSHANELIANTEEADAEGCFHILFFDVQGESNPAQLTALVQPIVACLSSGEDKPALRLRILANLFNSVCSASVTADGALRADVLSQIIAFASRTEQLELLNGYFDMLEALIAKWQLNAADQRRVFLNVAQAFEQQGSKAKAQQFLMKFLISYGSEPLPTEHTQYSVKAAVGAIESPIVCFTERHNMLGIAAIAQLESSAEHAKLFELVRIFSVGKLHDYLGFCQANAGVVEGLGLTHEVCLDNMRLLSMCSLATEHDEIPYQAISDTLDVPLEEVEAWVVKTITAKLIDAKIDQLQRVVMISRCTHRTFDRPQWEELSAKLATWKANVRSILETVQKTDVVLGQQTA